MPLTEEGLVPVPGMMSRWVRLGNGDLAHYMTSGETGPAVIMLHGGAAGSSGTAGWRFNAPVLGANGFRVYCPDQPGFGLADNHQEYWPVHGVHSHVEYLEQFTTALCLNRVHIVGNSMGCRNAAQYVIEHPERVISYTLIGGPIGDLVSPDARVGPPGANINIFDGTEESMLTLMKLLIHNTEEITDDLLQMRTLAAGHQVDSYDAWYASFLPPGAVPDREQNPNVLLTQNTKGRFDNITIPGIYIYGREDARTSVENGYLQEDVLPNVQFFYPEGCGHQSQTDRPELLNRMFLEFFRSGKVARLTADEAGISQRRPELPDLVEQRG
jgi:pimeloyl-ACP methyl ester carboxylesterase